MVKVTIDMSGLNRGLKLAQQYTKRTPANAVNTSAYFIAVNTQSAFPSTKISKIDGDLSVEYTAMIGKRGKPLKNRKLFSAKPGTAETSKDIALAVLIIQARANPSSKYNLATNSRYAAPSPWKGLNRAAGAAAMRAAVHSLIAQRHGSVSFFRAGFSDSINVLYPLANSRYYRGSPKRVGGVKTFGADLGSAIPAQQGSLIATCIIENNIGGEGVNSESMNKALNEIGLPILQRAIDGEGRAQLQYYLAKSAKEELEKDVNAAWK